MGTLNLRRFSKPELLRKIDKNHLITFFKPYSTYLSRRGVTLPSIGDKNGLDYETLSEILLSPNPSTPAELAEALYYVNEMSTPEGFDLIQDAIAETNLDMQISEEAAFADLALQVWMKDRNIIERLHAQQYLLRPRSFEYFRCTKRPVPEFEKPSDKTIAALEDDMNRWFAKKRRVLASKIYYQDS